MFVDASAIVAIVIGESEAPALAARLGQARAATTSPVAVYEAVMGIARAGRLDVSDAEALVSGFLAESRVEVVPITGAIGRLALDAVKRFGKGRHPAQLTMGDCFAYACARESAQPLLFKGDDFPLTDIEVA